MENAEIENRKYTIEHISIKKIIGCNCQYGGFCGTILLIGQ